MNINEPIKDIFQKRGFCYEGSRFDNHKWNCIKNITPKEFFEHCHSGTLRQHILHVNPKVAIKQPTNGLIGFHSETKVTHILHESGYCTKDFMCCWCEYEKEEKHKKKMYNTEIRKQLNKVSKDEVIDAIDYFWADGFIEELNYDQKHYVEILLKAAANKYRIKLYDENDRFAGYTGDRDTDALLEDERRNQDIINHDINLDCDESCACNE